MSTIIGEAPVIRMDELPGDYFLLGLDAPAQAARTRPGHFYMLGMPGARLSHDPLLNRPISALDVRPGPDGAPAEILFLIKKVGRGTRLLGRVRPGDRLLCHGPLGRPFPDPPPAPGCPWWAAAWASPRCTCARGSGAGPPRSPSFTAAGRRRNFPWPGRSRRRGSGAGAW